MSWEIFEFVKLQPNIGLNKGYLIPFNGKQDKHLFFFVTEWNHAEDDPSSAKSSFLVSAHFCAKIIAMQTRAMELSSWNYERKKGVNIMKKLRSDMLLTV